MFPQEQPSYANGNIIKEERMDKKEHFQWGGSNPAPHTADTLPRDRLPHHQASAHSAARAVRAQSVQPLPVTTQPLHGKANFQV